MKFANFNFEQFVKFIFSGLVAVICNFFSRIFLSLIFSYFISILLSQLIGMFIAYFLFSRHVFQNAKSQNIKKIKFILVNLLSVSIVLLVSFIFLDLVLPLLLVTKFVHEIAHFFGIASTALISYFLHKKWTFA